MYLPKLASGGSQWREELSRSAWPTPRGGSAVQRILSELYLVIQAASTRTLQQALHHSCCLVRLPVPEFAFIERVRIADAFFGPNAESTDGERSLARRIRPRTSARSVSLTITFPRSAACGCMLESTRSGAMYSESIWIRRRATTTAFEACLSLNPKRSMEDEPITCPALVVAGWSSKAQMHLKCHSAKVHRGPF